MSPEPDAFAQRVRRQPGRHRPWTRGQVRVVDSWPTRRDQPVSVALSPAGDRLALSVGHRLSVCDIVGGSRVESRLAMTCALAPGLTWSPDGGKLAFRDDDGQGRLVELPGPDDRSRGGGPGDGARSGEAMAFAPDGGRLAMLAPSLPGRMTLMVLTPDGSWPGSRS